MKKVELIDGIRSSVLGFGCAPILGSVNAKSAKRAIEIAIDLGINHFDLARSYGYGDAESFVGKLLKGRRSKMVLASKFGMKANWKALLFRPLKPIFRSIIRKKPTHYKEPGHSFLRPSSSIYNLLHSRVLLRSEEMRKSLEESLRALRTDYLDYFLIHEPGETITHIEELSATAELLKCEGKIRSWGLAYKKSEELFHTSYFNRFDVHQFNNSPGAPDYNRIVALRGQQSNIIFSPLSGGGKKINSSTKLKTLTIDFPKSVILCSMFNVHHINQNVQSVT